MFRRVDAFLACILVASPASAIEIVHVTPHVSVPHVSEPVIHASEPMMRSEMFSDAPHYAPRFSPSPVPVINQRCRHPQRWNGARCV